MQTLNYKKWGEGQPLLILHGLFGSLDNWQSIAKTIAEKGFEVWILDQRNHGRSFHEDEFSYSVLSTDLLEFLQAHNLNKIHLCGHSMGGKTAMQFTLMYPERINKLVICDISPAAFEDRHHEIFEALEAVPCNTIQTRDEADSILQLFHLDLSTRQFLLKNLSRNQQNKWEWRFNLKSLKTNYHAISAEISGNPTLTPTLFLKGQHSSYINASNYPEIEYLFPHHELIEIDGAGHWIHADQPLRFIQELLTFLKQ